MKKSILAFLLALCLLISNVPISFAFSDTDGHWAQEYIDRAVENQLFTGVTEDRFAPNDTMTRAMFVTVLGRFEGIDTDFWSREGAPQFFKQDVDNDAYYAPHIRWGVCNGIVNGVNDFLFAPNRAITREQMAKLISYYLDSMGHKLSTDGNVDSSTDVSSSTATDDNSNSVPTENKIVSPTDYDEDATLPSEDTPVTEGYPETEGDSESEGDPETEGDPEAESDPETEGDPDTDIGSGTDPDQVPGAVSFADEEDISSWALDSVLRLYSAGILTGFAEDDGTVTFRPKATATRAQCAAVFCRIQDTLIRSQTPPVVAEEITLNKEEVTLSEGYSFRLVATTKPENIQVLWRTSDSDIVTVDQEGLVTFVAPGHAQVSVYTRNGLYDVCNFICEGPADEEDTGNSDTGDDDTTTDDTDDGNSDNDDTGNNGGEDSGDQNTGDDNTQTTPNPNLPNADFTKEEKCIFMFGESVKDPRLYYSTASEAEAHMVKVDIRTWDLRSNGDKYTRTWTLTVHESLAETVKAIFEDIYNGPEKFPIHQVYCYSWSGKSEHSIGAAIDINWDENYYCDPNGNAITGNFWKPGENPYSIPPGGDVTTAFNKYGYIWCINWNSGYKDYMHFSFFGT